MGLIEECEGVGGEVNNCYCSYMLHIGFYLTTSCKVLRKDHKRLNYSESASKGC